MFSQVVRAGRLDRSFYTSLVFDERAVGNAVAIMAGLGIIMFARLSLLSVLYAALYGMLRGFISAGLSWAAAALIFRRSGRFLTAFRLAGFAHVGFAPAAAVSFVPGSVPGAEWLSLAALLVSLTWYGAAMRVAAEAQFDLTGGRAWLCGTAAAAGWLIARMLGI